MSEWKAFFELEPFGDIREDYRAALIAQTIANIHRGAGRPPYRLKDFIIEFDGEERANKAPQSVEDQIQVMQRLTRALKK